MATTDLAIQGTTLKALLGRDAVKKRFEEMLGRKAAGFMTSIINVVNQNKQLQSCDPNLVVGAAAIAASMDLPIDPNLGFSYIVPYSGKPQFQMGYKGYIQLAMRSGQYRTMNVCEVYEGELESVNRFTGELTLNPDGKKSDEVVGYVAYMKLTNGFEKYLYMTVDEIKAHAKKYSQGYGKSWSRWTTDFHTMAAKTVLKRLLSKWGILSIDMQLALKADQAHVIETEDGYEFEYPDGTGGNDDPPPMKNITPQPDLNARLAEKDTEKALDDVAKRVQERDATLPGMTP